MTQFYVYIHTLYSDNIKEYLSINFQAYMFENSILYQSSCVDISSQNGVVEKKNLHFFKVARALFFQMKVPK